ncbi:COG0702 Predicted nucleoside-diphosphate-sugar epimerases [Burkholderiales bacterium]
MTPYPRSVAILGGTGFIGRALCNRLSQLDSGPREIRVLTRSRGRARALWILPKLQVLEVDYLDEASLAEGLHGCEAVVNLVGLLHSRPGKPWGPDFDEAHVRLPARLARSMARNQIRRLIHISALGVSSSAPSMYLRSKAAGEALLRGAESIDLTILRPSVVFGPEDQFVRLFAKLSRWLPIIPLASPHARFQPIYVGDLVQAITQCLQETRTIGQVFEIAGEDVLTLYEVVHWAATYSGHPRIILPLSDGLAQLQALIMEHLPGPTLVSRDNLASATIPSLASGPMSPLLNLGPLTRFHSAVPKMLGKA